MMFWYGDHTSSWAWVLMTFGMVAFWGLLITGIVMLTRYGASGTPTEQRPSAELTPERLLAERFARGDIDENEYTGRLAALRGQVRS